MFRVQYVLTLLLIVSLVCVVSAQDTTDDAVEERSRRRRLILPLLLGVVLKASTLVPMSLMFMTFLVVSSVFAAKLALGLSTAVAVHSSYDNKPHHGQSGGPSSYLNELAASVPHSLPVRRRYIKG